MTYTALKQMRGEPIAFADLFRAGRFLLPFFAVNIIGGIMLILGLALCCIPGILVGGILTPTYALIVDRRIGSFKALGLSIQFCRQNLLLFAVYFLVVVLIYQFAAGFIIAIAFAYPLYTIAQAVAYYDLTYGLPGSSATPGAPAMPPTPPYQPPPIAP